MNQIKGKKKISCGVISSQSVSFLVKGLAFTIDRVHGALVLSFSCSASDSLVLN